MELIPLTLGSEVEHAVLYKGKGAFVASVSAGSIAEEIGIVPGTELLRIDGEPPRDAIDFQWAEAMSSLTLTVRAPDGVEREIDIEKDPDEPLGIGFATDLFDGLKRCNNHCPFCFLDQLPKGLRRTLYVKDDDYRLSFLYGHYVTLTNLRESDFERILRLRLSPLYVSVHATDVAVRRRCLGNPKAAPIMPILQRLMDGGIELHTQVVLTPGINDGGALTQTVRDLAALFPGVPSLSIVPVGLTKFMPAQRGLRLVSLEEARQVIQQVHSWQQEFHPKFGVNFVYASDEMYLLAGEELPSAKAYDEYPQYSNGVGMARVFLDELAEAKGLELRVKGSTLNPQPSHLRATLVTGSLAVPFVQQLSDFLNDSSIAESQVIVIRNDTFGETCTVAGLLTGQDILHQLRGRDLGDIVFLPRYCVNEEATFLDEMTVAQLEQELNVKCDASAYGPRGVVERLMRDEG
jgi:putative radical SAM enzyme (TIGR03279 family)